MSTTTTTTPPVAADLSPSIFSTIKNFIIGPPAAAGIAGLLEVCVFHGFDTTSKRLMKHEGKVIVPSDPRGSLERLQFVILKENNSSSSSNIAQSAEGKSATKKAPLRPLDVFKSLYQGTKWAMCYKISQRTVKFAGQPILRDIVHERGASDYLTEKFGKKTGKILLESTCGAVVGSFEIILLPFDRMKVLSQTNASALGNRGIVEVARVEGMRSLYAGSMTTLVRNVPGTFALFCGTAYVKDTMFHLEDYRKATWYQNFVASAFGATLGVIITSPMDVIKTRIQSKNMQDKESGMQIFLRTCKNEGFSAFYKGITPKILSVAPRLVFTYTVTQQLTGYFKKQ